MEARKDQYEAYVKWVTPVHSTWKNVLMAGISGGLICLAAQISTNCLVQTGMEEKTAALWTMLGLILLSVILTGANVFQRLARVFGAGVLVPITGWAAYLSGLAVGIGCIVTEEDGSALFLKAIPYNFYAILAVIMVGLIGSGIIKDFGPMKKAEERAMNEGKVLRDGAVPLIGKELTEMKPYEGIKPRIFLNFLLPVLMIISIALGTYITLGSAKTMEAFLFVIIFMSISMLLQGIPFQEIMNTLTQGIKGAVPAVTLLALAYSINALSKDMGTANYIVSLSESFLTLAMLPAIIFIISAIMAFATGSSWGTFAICMPIALPLAFTFTGGELGTLVYACFGAVAGGGVFGDHCSPLSDTTVLSSTGSASDHIDHVQTQLPYALCCGTLAVILYLVIGFAFV